MIITIILYLIYGIVWTICQTIALLPNVSQISAIGTAVTTVSGYLASLDTFLPITAILAILSAFIVYEFSYFSFKVVYWIIRRIPTQSQFFRYPISKGSGNERVSFSARWGVKCHGASKKNGERAKYGSLSVTQVALSL